MLYGRLSVSRSQLLALAALLCATAVSGSLAPSDVWAGQTEPSGAVASFLSQSELKNLSLVAKHLNHMLSLAESLKPRGLFRLTGTTGTFPFCKALDLSRAEVPDLLEVLTAQRFPSLVSLDLGKYTGVELPEQPLQPLPVLASVKTLRVTQDFLHFHLIPEIFPNLQSLTVVPSWPPRFIDWSFLTRLQVLSELHALSVAFDPEQLEFLPTTLTILGINNIDAPIALPNLQELTVVDRWTPHDLSTLEASRGSLRKLRICSAPNLVDVRSLRLFAGTLEELEISAFSLSGDFVESLEVIRFMTNLRYLGLYAKSAPAELDASRVFGPGLVSLKKLRFSNFSATNIQLFINSLPRLENLDLSIFKLTDHRSLDVSHLQNLEILILWATQLTDLFVWNETLNRGPTRLETLSAGDARSVHGLAHLKLMRSAELLASAVLPEHIGQLTNLRRLTCHGIPYVEPLATLVHLEELEINYGNTPDLSSLVGIEKLSVTTRAGSGPIAQVLARIRNSGLKNTV